MGELRSLITYAPANEGVKTVLATISLCGEHVWLNNTNKVEDRRSYLKQQPTYKGPILQCLPTAVINRRFQLSGNEGGDSMTEPHLSHLLKPSCVQVLSPPASDQRGYSQGVSS